MKFTSEQEQIILGTLLGNGCIKNDKLVLKSNCNLWLECKVKALEPILSGKYYNQNSNFYWESDPADLSKFYNLTYENDEKVANMDCLDRLTNIGIMVWYGDVGCLVGRARKNACLRIQHLSNTAGIANQFFNEVGIPCKINRIRKKPVLVFSVKGTETLFKIIGSILPKNRYHLMPLV